MPIDNRDAAREMREMSHWWRSYLIAAADNVLDARDRLQERLDKRTRSTFSTDSGPSAA